MDLELKCNITKCRRKIQVNAYLTSCSHIFCADCATKAFGHALVCPACENPLVDAKDIYYADLKPSEEWKSVASYDFLLLDDNFCAKARDY